MLILNIYLVVVMEIRDPMQIDSIDIHGLRICPIWQILDHYIVQLLKTGTCGTKIEY